MDSDSSSYASGGMPAPQIFPGHLGGDDDSSDSFTSAILMALIIVIAIVIIISMRRGKENFAQHERKQAQTRASKARPEKFCQAQQPPSKMFTHPEWDKGDSPFTTGVHPDAMWDSTPDAIANAENAVSAEQGKESPHREGVYQALSMLYSSSDVDPLVTGQAYAYRDNTRSIYDQRTSHGGVWGMQEFSSSGNPGDVGVDVGPVGLTEYEGSTHGYDDGIPENWRFPSDPIRWYKPRQRDFYGPEGATAYTEGMFNLTTPDHDPRIGQDEGPDY